MSLEKPEHINLLNKVEEYKNSLSDELNNLENKQLKTIEESSRYKTLMDVETSLDLIINEYVAQEYKEDIQV